MRESGVEMNMEYQLKIVFRILVSKLHVSFNGTKQAAFLSEYKQCREYKTLDFVLVVAGKLISTLH